MTPRIPPDRRRLRAALAGLGLWLALCGAPVLALVAVPGSPVAATAAAFPLLAVAVLVRGRTGWQLAARMEREARAVAERTRLRERTRIAGDMHDSLGHDLALIALRAGALELAPELSAERRAAAGELRAAAGSATERLAEIIGVLRTDDEGAPRLPAGESVPRLVERARASGMTVTLEQPDDAAGDGLPAMTGHALHRVVQESLTNAAKHAPGAAVRVRITREAEELAVTVTHPARPAGPAPAPVSGGSGLVGLDERVRLAGGALRAGPAPDGGFTVSARLPTSGGTPPAPLRGPETTATGRELAHARQQVRRRLRQTLAVPFALLAALVVLMGLFHLLTPSWTVLERQSYDRLRPGDARSRVESVLPFFALDAPPDGTPPPPPGRSCVYYGVSPDSAAAYELCFAGDRLATKRVARERPRR
ncbi:sensor histidine kinase [Streptomyces lydicus]|uniref:sensor histidine kinase n=1 Tax=Streptomyces lydicus TaxID=47763 RepID=UPI0037A91721